MNRRCGALTALLRLAPASTTAQEVTNGHHPVWGPDGRIYFHVEQGDDVSIYSMDADGGDVRREGLFTADLDGNGSRPLTTEPGMEAYPWRGMEVTSAPSRAVRGVTMRTSSMCSRYRSCGSWSHEMRKLFRITTASLGGVQLRDGTRLDFRTSSV